ncbi:hypothetical protein [Oceanibaculum nanhaiense]|uniref:hypothetical protein n=1 Tax=Oceanibaculum nanhaiense TaxID=1909734 RepID=UPI00396E3297
MKRAAMSPAEQLKDTVWQKIVSLAKTDGDFRHRLQAEPFALLQSVGISVPPDIRFICVETEPSGIAEVLGRSAGLTVYVPVVVANANDELDDTSLDAVVGGAGQQMAMPMPANFVSMVSFADGGSGGF